MFHYAPNTHIFTYIAALNQKAFSLTDRTTLGTDSVLLRSVPNSLSVRLFQKMLLDHITHGVWCLLFLELLKQLVSVCIS